MPNVLQKVVVNPSAAVTLVTTAETLVVYSGRCEITFNTIRAVIKGWMNGTWGTGTTAVTARIRRGNGIAGTQIVGVGPQQVTAGNISDLDVWGSEQLLNQEFQDYSLTIQQTAATANGTINSAQIEVEMLNG